MVYDQGEDLSKYWQAIYINIPPKNVIEAHQAFMIYLKSDSLWISVINAFVFILMLLILVNDFSVILGQSPVFLG